MKNWRRENESSQRPGEASIPASKQRSCYEGGARPSGHAFLSQGPTMRINTTPVLAAFALAASLVLGACATPPAPAPRVKAQDPDDGPPVSLSRIEREFSLRRGVNADGQKVLFTPAGHELRLEIARSTWDLDASSRPVPPPGIRKEGGRTWVPAAVWRRLKVEIPIADRSPAPKILPVATAPLEGRRIVIDPGHGGRDGGASAVGNLREKDLNLAVSKLLIARLKTEGARVISTRESDRFIELSKRARIANQDSAEVFISIHANNSTNPGAQGIEVWHPTKGKRGQSSQRLASDLCRELVSATGAKMRGPKADRRGLAVLRKTTMPAALVEIGFVSNRKELGRLADSKYQRLLADGIVLGLKRWFSTR